MQKILFCLLLVSVASFGQSDKVKQNSNNDSIYKSLCFTLNDSVSVFKFFDSYNFETVKGRRYKIEDASYEDILKCPLASAAEFTKEVSDGSSINIIVETLMRSALQRDKKANIKKTITTIGNKYTATKLEIRSKLETMDMLENLYILEYNNKFITLGLTMQKTKNTNYYLQKFNKLVNTIRFK